MKIALIAPSPVPFVIGGAENLWTGWIAALNEQPGVEADLIKLPSPERDFWEIVDSYRQWARLDLRHFDRVISTKYPAWMVAHPDHHVFLQHKLRGLYDTWPAQHSTTVACDSAPVRALMDVLQRAGTERAALDELFATLDAVRDVALELPPGLFSLPGALIRAVVHRLDAIGLARTAIRRYAAISATVRARADYFPQGAQVEVLHHPTLPRPRTGASRKVPKGAIFTASRLDTPKRLDWIIAAYVQSGVQAPLVIAGDGPCRAALEAQAKGHPGIHLVGRLSDVELAAAYRKASFVPFVPDREDYGLITLEALQAGKPVLTCSDSGGVTELVRDGENGVVTAADTAALAAGMKRLAEDKALRTALGGRAAASVAHIRWPALAAAFSRPWKRIVVANTFPIHPASNGGQVRMLNLYLRLAEHADITVVCLGPGHLPAQAHTLRAGLRQVVAPMSAAHTAFEIDLGARLRASCTDVAAMLEPTLSPAWVAALAEACASADVVVACHPYAYPAIRTVWTGPVVYESLNVESDLKAAIFGHDTETLAKVHAVEAECARQAPLVLCCSAEDAARMQAVYALPRLPAVVPNGVDAESYPEQSASTRAALRARLGLDAQGAARALAIFVASLHGPNIDALRSLMAWAPHCPEVLFGIVGSVCDADGLPLPPANVLLVGRVSDAELRVWLAAADVGLNPMVSGSGTNLKMLEYAAAGVPILSTPFGGRGGILEAGRHYRAAEIADFPRALGELLAPAATEERASMVAQARARAIHAGDWRAIAERMWAALGDGGLLAD